MATEVMVAIITGICAIVGQWMITRSESKKGDAKRAKEQEERAVEQAIKETELKAHLDSIEKKLDIHNGYAEKLAQISIHLEEIDKAIIAMQKDIEYIRGGGTI